MAIATGPASRTVLLATLVLLAFGAGLGVVVVTGEPDCPVELTELDVGGPELVVRDLLAPQGTVAEERGPELDAFDALGPPFGDLLSGRFSGPGRPVPTPVASGRGVVLVDADDRSVAFRAVDLPDGTLRWGRSSDSGPARGGLVGDQLVVLTGGASPALIALDAGDGAQSACVAVPAGGTYGEVDTLLTDQAGDDVVVAIGAPAGPVTLSRLTPATGRVVWERSPEELPEAGSVTVAGDAMVVGRIGNDPVRLADMAAAGGIAGPMVTAYSLADGSDRWSWPADADARSTAALVVGSAPGADRLVVLAAERGSTGGTSGVVARLAGLDPDGRQLWSARLGRGYWSAALWGEGLVVAQGGGRRGGARLRAFSAEDGSYLWSLGSRALPASGDQPRTNFGSAVSVGDGFLVPAPNGLVLVDPATGTAERLDLPVAVDQVLPAGDFLLVRTRDALLVLARSA